MESLKVCLKGAWIGGTMMIPGVSGGTMAIIMGIYDRLLSSITTILADKEKRMESFFFLLKFCIGGLLGILIVAKPFSMLLLGKRVTALLRRCGKNPELKQMKFGDVMVDFSGYTASDAVGRIDITPKEIDLLKLLCEHKGMVLSRTQILDDLWGYDAPIIDRTIDTYIKNLRKKLRLDCIVTVKGVGYKYEEMP